MPNIFVRIMLFFSSYAPLGVIMGVLSYKASHAFAASILLFSTASVLVVITYLQQAQKLEPTVLNTSDVKRTDGETTSYLVTYLVPFLATPFDDKGEITSQFLGLAMFFVVVAVLYINSGMFHINPTLNLLGWRIYEVTSDEDKKYSVITRHRLQKRQALKVIAISDDVFVESEK